MPHRAFVGQLPVARGEGGSRAGCVREASPGAERSMTIAESFWSPKSARIDGGRGGPERRSSGRPARNVTAGCSSTHPACSTTYGDGGHQHNVAAVTALALDQEATTGCVAVDVEPVSGRCESRVTRPR